MSIPVASPLVKYVDADGKLTQEGLRLFVRVLAKIRNHEERLEALEP